MRSLIFAIFVISFCAYTETQIEILNTKKTILKICKINTREILHKNLNIQNNKSLTLLADQYLSVSRNAKLQKKSLHHLLFIYGFILDLHLYTEKRGVYENITIPCEQRGTIDMFMPIHLISKNIHKYIQCVNNVTGLRTNYVSRGEFPLPPSINK